MACIKNIQKDIEFDCLNPPSQGIEKNVVLINSDDVDRTLSTVATDGTINLQLKPEKTGFLIEGVKQIHSFNYEVEVNDDSLNKVIHRFIGKIWNLSPANKEEINAYINGANVIAVVENKSKGADNKNAFEILGWRNGLEISEGGKNSQENDGAFNLTLASNPLSLEPKVPATLLDVDYATTKTAFDNKFTTITPPV